MLDLQVSFKQHRNALFVEIPILLFIVVLSYLLINMIVVKLLSHRILLQLYVQGVVCFIRWQDV